MVTTSRCRRETLVRLAGGLVLLLAASGTAAAQSGSSTLSGFSKSPSSFESPVNVSTRDANGNFTVVDGVIQAAAAGSIFANASGVGSVSSSTGAGTASTTGSNGVGSASAIGNNLSVVVSGDNNTVIVNATQTNNGAVSASTVLNGKVNLDGSQ